MTIQEKAIEQLERISEHLSAIGEKEDYTDIAINALRHQTDEEAFITHKEEVLERIAKREAEIDKYMKELEKCKQQPSENCISREAVNVLVDELARAISDERIGISRGRSTATVMRDILHLPSVTPQRQKGKWIKIPVTLCHYPCDGCVKDKSHANDEWCSSCEFWRAEDFDCKCSECGKVYSEVENYCPNCGSYNGGGEDEAND